MAVTVVLGVELDPWMLMAQDSQWRSEGYIVIHAYSVRDAIDHFNAGDFDLVLLGCSMTMESKKRLTSLIRASGSYTPVVSIAGSREVCHTFADATLTDDPRELLKGIKEVSAARTRMPAAMRVA
jgi:DNA-binding response OmpR family regulator